ncbi:SLC13 family permease [Rubeoparvulum massiliense]|uniref:SLC13 family permease n=1 Tax=Rubeoparvulum massiliense TaxID=1631346 RepID=UPI00065DEBC9|nr:DASS family sodium-coupled anion symporter [Rubeoparvulum massiliense]
MWDIHDETKKLLRFFVKPDTTPESMSKTTKPSHNSNTTGSGGGNNMKNKTRSLNFGQRLGLLLGPTLFIIFMFVIEPAGMTPEARAVLAGTLWIATWWITEAIPIPATSLLPIIIFPLTGALGTKAVTSSYGDPTIFLFMGGFMIALAMERWNLHKRIALSIISVIGTSTEMIILGFMVATGFLSMWISNTATAMMMVPIGMAIIYQISETSKHNNQELEKNFGKAIMIAIAYAASIGGLGTLIGTPPNAIFASQVSTLYGVEISFAKWMMFGTPLAAILLFVAWFYLVKIAFPLKVKAIPGGKALIRQEKTALGKMSYEEIIVAIVFALAALSWIFRDFVINALLESKGIKVDDTMIAILFAVILFIIPARSNKAQNILDWGNMKDLPWGILLLFGGGLAIAAGFKGSGLSEWIGNQLIGLEGLNFFLVILLVTGLVTFLTEITSNTATATMMFPIMASLALALNVHPYALMVAAGLAASCAFMLPVATPPNAVVFGSGYLQIKDMAKTGFWINIISMIIIATLIYFVLPVIWNIDLNIFPDSFRS